MTGPNALMLSGRVVFHDLYRWSCFSNGMFQFRKMHFLAPVKAINVTLIKGINKKLSSQI